MSWGLVCLLVLAGNAKPKQGVERATLLPRQEAKTQQPELDTSS